MSGIGSLVIDLSANIAQFSSSLDKAAALAEARAKQIDSALGIVQKSLTTLGAGFAVGLTFDAVQKKIEGVIESAAGLQELAARTGATVEKLSGLASVAKLSGTDTEALATGLQKLSKNMVDAQDGGAKSTEAFKAIGISVKDIVGLRPDAVFELIARKMADYGDGAGKTAVAQELLGKAGANLLPVMKDVADLGDLQVKVTAAQSEQARLYETHLKQLNAAQNAVYKTVAMEVLPVMDAFAKAMLEAVTQSDGVKGAIDGLAKDGSIREWAEDAARVVGFVVDAFDGVARVAEIVGKRIGAVFAAGVAVAHFDFAAAKNIMSEYHADVDSILQKSLFSDRLKAQLDQIGAGGSTGDFSRLDRRSKPQPNYHPNTAAAKDDPARAQMEGQIKAGEQMIAAVQKQFATREAVVKDAYAMQQIDATTYYASEKQAIADALAGKLAALAKEQAGVDQFAKTHKSQKEQQDAVNRSSQIASEVLAAQTEATERNNKVDRERADALIAIDLQTKNQVYQWGQQNETMQFQLDMMGKSTLAVQQLTAARAIDMQIEQERHALEQKGFKDNADAQEKLGELVAKGEAQKAIVAAKISAGFDKQTSGAFGAQEALRKYAEDAANLGTQIESAMTNSFKGMEDALVSFVTTGKMNFKSLADSIISDLTRIIIKEQITGPLAKMMGGSGGGGLLSALFGGSGGAQAAFSQTSLGSSGFGSGLAYGNMDLGLALADGGEPPVGKTSLVGENGPELFIPRSAGMVVPNDFLQGGSGGSGDMRLTIVNNTSGRIDKVTQRQISPTERALVIEESVKAVAGHMYDANSPVSRAISSNYNLQRAR